MNSIQAAPVLRSTIANSDNQHLTIRRAGEETIIGVSKTQCGDPDEQNDEFEAFGVSCHGNAALASKESNSVLSCLKEEATKGRVKVPALDWPQQSTEAISEFDTSIRLSSYLLPIGTFR